MKRALVALPLAATTLALALPAQAATAHGPATTLPSATSSVSARTTADIAHAVRHNRFTGDVPADQIAVSAIRIAPPGRWASALASPRNGMTDPAQVLLHRTGGQWRAVDRGTDGVGCGIAPAAVRAQLHLHGHC